MILDPVTLTIDETVAEALAAMKKFGISGLPITDNGKVLGIVTNRDLRFEEDLKRPISEVMTPWDRLVTGTENIPMDEAVRLMHKSRIEKLPIVDGNRQLKGLITIKDVEKLISFPHSNRDSKGRLRVGAAVGTGEDAKTRITALRAAGVDFVTVDTAHGASKNVVEVVRWSKKTYPGLDLHHARGGWYRGSAIHCDSGLRAGCT
jgi:IMP dehydrogenase